MSKAGTWNLLQKSWIKELARQVANHPEVSPLLPENAVAVQCTYFSKTLENNWLVALHRDKSVPVAQKFSNEGWSGWSVKEGTYYVQPPEHVLHSLLTVRIHFEDNNTENGALQVVPGSHNKKRSALSSSIDPRSGWSGELSNILRSNAKLFKEFFDHENPDICSSAQKQYDAFIKQADFYFERETQENRADFESFE